MKKKNIMITVGSMLLVLVLIVIVILSKSRKVTCKFNYEDDLNKINYKYVIEYKYLFVKNVEIEKNQKFLYKNYDEFTMNIINNKEKEELLKEYKKLALNGNEYKAIGYKISTGLDYIKLKGNIDYEKLNFKKIKKDKKNVSEIEIKKGDTIMKYKKELKKQGYLCK